MPEVTQDDGSQRVQGPDVAKDDGSERVQGPGNEEEQEDNDAILMTGLEVMYPSLKDTEINPPAVI